MTDLEALQCVGILVTFDRRDWSDAQVAAWTAAFTAYALEPARRASTALVANREPRDWSLAAWRECYRQANASMAPVSLPPVPTGRVVSLAEHIAWLEASDHPGDEDELAIWRRVAERQARIGDRVVEL